MKNQLMKLSKLLINNRTSPYSCFTKIVNFYDGHKPKVNELNIEHHGKVCKIVIWYVIDIVDIDSLNR